MSVATGRAVGPNELRCIARQSLELYRGLLVGGIYSIPASREQDIEIILHHAVSYCISKHPILSAVIEDEDTQHPRFAKPGGLDLRKHVDVRSSDPRHAIDNDADLESLLEKLGDTTLPDRSKVPPWRVVALKDNRVNRSSPNGSQSYIILLHYYHSHGDGMAGVAFAKTLLEALNQSAVPKPDAVLKGVIKPTRLPFLPPVEKAANLTLSWLFILSPLLSLYLPRFLAGFLGFRASALPKADDHWAGRRIIDPKDLVTGVKILTIPGRQVDALLKACRERQARLTGLLHQLVVRALSELLPADTPAHCFVSQSAVDMRRNIESLSGDDMALCVTGYYETFPRATEDLWAGWTTGNSSHPVWVAVKKTTDGLAKTAGTLHNQPVGLLRFLSDMRGWTLGSIGKARECTYELSNLRAVDAPRKPGDICELESMIFSQPANMAGGCFDVNVVSKQGGEMTVTMCWQLGALAVGDEKGFMAKLCSLIETYVAELVVPRNVS